MSESAWRKCWRQRQIRQRVEVQADACGMKDSGERTYVQCRREERHAPAPLEGACIYGEGMRVGARIKQIRRGELNGKTQFFKGRINRQEHIGFCAKMMRFCPSGGVKRAEGNLRKWIYCNSNEHNSSQSTL